MKFDNLQPISAANFATLALLNVPVKKEVARWLIDTRVKPMSMTSGPWEPPPPAPPLPPGASARKFG